MNCYESQKESQRFRHIHGSQVDGLKRFSPSKRWVVHLPSNLPQKRNLSKLSIKDMLLLYRITLFYLCLVAKFLMMQGGNMHAFTCLKNIITIFSEICLQFMDAIN